MIEVYTDGACKGNPGPGGWGWVVPDGPWANGAEADSTNQRMELMAVLDALRNLSGRVEVVSDSTYVVNCFRDGWWEGWMKRGWKNSKKEPVANRDLWEPLVDLYRSRDDELTFRWVKGHAGNEWNDVADRLAVEAAETQRSRSGTGRPDEFGPADDIGGTVIGGTAAAPSTPDAEGRFGSTWRPAGRSMVVLGLQPPGLGGYDENETAADVRRRLAEIIEAKQRLDPDLVVLTGLRLGAETLGAEAATAAGVPYVAVLPYPDADAKWPAESRRRFAELIEAAAAVVLLERKAPDTTSRAGQAMDRRNGWFRTVADEALIVWDGTERRVGEMVTRFEQEMPDDVWVIGP
ncbi:MAG: ribonuclease H [Acidimicrobiales bacterium]